MQLFSGLESTAMLESTKKRLQNTLLSVSETAAILETSRNQVNWLIRTGRLDAVKIGNALLIARADIQSSHAELASAHR